jgi:hypothetical protein
VRLKISVLILTLALLASCSLPGKTTPTATVSAPTSAPTLTATLPAEPLVILVLPADMPRAEYDYNQKLIYDLAQAEGMRFQVRNTLTAADMEFEGPALKVVVAFPPDPGLVDLAAASPSVQFLAINIPGLTAGSNLSTIGATGVPVDQQAFLAGYIAGLVAPEWKVGVIYQKDTPAGETARDAFANGFVFYCGTCRNPLFPQPSGIYPVFVGIPTDAQPGEYPAYADLLFHNVVKAAFVFPAVATPDLLNYMTQNGMLLVGETMPGETARPNWVASIQPDIIAAIQTTFPELVAGKGGQSVPTPLFLNDINPDLLSEGKVRLVQQVLEGLQNGTISTGVSP